MGLEIIDFHIHPFIDPENNFCHYRERLHMDIQTTLNDMDAAGISIFCGSVITRMKKEDGFKALKKCNRAALKLREIYGERYIPGIHVHPDYISESVEELEWASKEGIKLVGELVPYMCGWSDYSCRGFSEILNEVGRHDMVVSVHTIDLGEMEKMATEHKDISFVFAHPGEKDMVLNHVEIMRKLDNVYLDLSGLGLFRYGLVRYLVDQVGAERILFGTDYPICNLNMFVGAIMGEKLTDRERELIFGGNAKRLLCGSDISHHNCKGLQN